MTCRFSNWRFGLFRRPCATFSPSVPGFSSLGSERSRARRNAGICELAPIVRRIFRPRWRHGEGYYTRFSHRVLALFSASSASRSYRITRRFSSRPITQRATESPSSWAMDSYSSSPRDPTVLLAVRVRPSISFPSPPCRFHISPVPFACLLNTALLFLLYLPSCLDMYRRSRDSSNRGASAR